MNPITNPPMRLSTLRREFAGRSAHKSAQMRRARTERREHELERLLILSGACVRSTGTADEATEEPASDAVKKPYDTIYQFSERRLWASPSGSSALTRLYGPRPLATE